MALGPGARLGSYEVTALISSGGMGEVWQARDTTLDRDVALKVLPEHVAADPDLKQRFERVVTDIVYRSIRKLRISQARSTPPSLSLRR